MGLDREAAWLRNPDFFPRFEARGAPRPLAELNLDPEALVMVWSYAGETRAALVRQLTYHHSLQHEMGGEPFCVSFCHVCHAGVGFDPRVDGELLHFSCGGLHHGQSLLIDDETQSYWDPLAGVCLHGRLEGKRLTQFSVDLMSCHEATSAHPDLLCYVADRSLAQTVFGRFGMFRLKGKGFLPPGFKGTMGGEDTRCPRMQKGLGVVVLKQARWYPEPAIINGVVDTWGRRELRVQLRPDGFPAATWSDQSRPLQFQCRWYAFSFSYPDCEVFGS